MKIKKFIVSVLVMSVLVFGGCYNTTDTTVDMTPRLISAQDGLSTTAVVENVKSAVVGIVSTLSNGSALGSGVAIEDGGYILTNHHVIENANSLTLYYADKTSGGASVIWSDSSLDLAIIKSNINMPYLQCGTSADLSVGEDVIAIGTPLTLQFKHTVTKGIISALNRTLEVGSLSDATYLQNLIQHDASINPGNSGGPLITLDSKLVGINTLKADAEGIGFAIPIEIGSTLIKQIVADNTYVPAYIGVFGFDASIASFNGDTSESDGVFVVTIDKASPAKIAGLNKGDVIIAVGDKKISTVMDLRIALYSYKKGDRVSVKVLRNGKEMYFGMQAGNRG